MVYTQMGGSTTINVMVYPLFKGSPKIKVWHFTLVFYWVAKTITLYTPMGGSPIIIVIF